MAVEPAKRRQAEARRIAKEAYPYKCCCVCGIRLDTTLDLLVVGVLDIRIATADVREHYTILTL